MRVGEAHQHRGKRAVGEDEQPLLVVAAGPDANGLEREIHAGVEHIPVRSRQDDNIAIAMIRSWNARKAEPLQRERFPAGGVSTRSSCGTK